PGAQPVRSAAGQSLGAIAPAWAQTSGQTAQQQGHLPDMPVAVTHDVLANFCAGIGAGCSDGMRDGYETDIDCGGNDYECEACADGQHCERESDCVDLQCVNGVCQAARCDDGVQNGLEVSVDCGSAASCPPCADDASCEVTDDCASGSCYPYSDGGYSNKTEF